MAEFVPRERSCGADKVYTGAEVNGAPCKILPMRLKLFDHIPYLGATIFAACVAILQIVERTALPFAVFTFVYILVATAAFNEASGLTTLPGTYIFFNATLTCIVGVVVKICIGEPGEAYLKAGSETMGVYVLIMVSMLLAVSVEKRFRSRRPLLPHYLPLPDLRGAFLGSAVVSVVAGTYAIAAKPPAPGSLVSLLLHLDRFLPFAIILGTMLAVRNSEGRSSASLLVVALILFGTARGFLDFSKETLFSPSVAWLLGLFGAGYRLKLRDVLIFAAIVLFMVRIAIPWSQFGRSVRDPDATLLEGLPVSIALASNFGEVRSGYENFANDDTGDALWQYFGTDVGQFGRLTMLPPDDALVELTDRIGPFGFRPLAAAFGSLVPHFIWRDKPDTQWGNLFARQAGANPYDDTTGIAFSPAGDAYREGGIFGVVIVAPFVFIYFFMICSYLLGKPTEHIGSLVMALICAHLAPEGMLQGLLSSVSIMLSVVFVVLICRYVFPLAGLVFRGNGSTRTLSYGRT